MNPGKVYLTDAEYQELIDAVKANLVNGKFCGGALKGLIIQRRATPYEKTVI